MMIKKVKTSFGGGSKRAKTTDFGGILGFKPRFCQSAPTKLAEKMYLGDLQLPPNFKPKY